MKRKPLPLSIPGTQSVQQLRAEAKLLSSCDAWTAIAPMAVKANRGVNLISFGDRPENGVTVRRTDGLELEPKFYEILTVSTIFTKCPCKIGSHN